VILGAVLLPLLVAFFVTHSPPTLHPLVLELLGGHVKFLPQNVCPPVIVSPTISLFPEKGQIAAILSCRRKLEKFVDILQFRM
jgi:hypothetical protein